MFTCVLCSVDGVYVYFYVVVRFHLRLFRREKKKCIQGSQQLINLPCAICLSVCGCMAFWFFNDFALYKWILRGSVGSFFFVDFLYVPFPDFWVHLCWFFSSSSFFCCYLVAHFIHSKYFSIGTRMLGLKWLFVNKNFFFRNFSIGNNRATKFQRKRKYTQKIKSRNIERYKNGVFARNNVMLNWWIPTCLL